METNIPTDKGLITIRAAIVQDASLVWALRLQALASDPPAFAADYEISAKETAEKWANLIKENAANDNGIIYIAEVRNNLIGMCGITRGHWPKTRHSAVIWGVYVTRDWRRHQIAQAMMDACCGWGKEHGLTIVKLGVSTLNDAAIRCYTRSGFSTYGTEPKALLYGGAYIDEYLMAKHL